MRPVFRHLAQTRIRCGTPLITARIKWRFGLNHRAVTPVIFRPAPPLMRAIPRRLMVRPATGPLPQMAHDLAARCCVR